MLELTKSYYTIAQYTVGKTMTDINNNLANYPIHTVEELAYAFEPPKAQAKFKTQNSDFIVREVLSFEPEGEGTHAYLYIQKINTNTEWLARKLAEFVGVEVKEIGYAGLKDRHAITEQWFSINLEIIEAPNWDNFQVEGVTLLKKTLHRRKLKRGSIKYNQFDIILRQLKQTNQDELIKKVHQIQSLGIPNYFAQQRFGYDYNNLSRAARWFNGHIKIKKRAEKSIILSAARSMVFNQMLSQRILSIGWDKLLNGDIMMLSGTHSIFDAPEINDDLQQRFNTGDIHPTVALWGKNSLEKAPKALSQWCAGLEKQGLKQERRSIRLIPKNMSIQCLDDSLTQVTLSFSLPSGTYATAVLRELVQF